MTVREWVVGVAALLVVTGGLFAQSGTPILKDDLVLGVNSTSTTDSIRWVRGGNPGVVPGNDGVSLAPRPWVKGYLQSVEFDNANNISHNAAGNLLAVDYGTTTVGLTVYQLATDGSGGITAIGNCAGLGGLSTVARGGGLSVAPDNSKIALTTYDTQQVIVYDYNAGTTIGTGAGASLSGGRATAGTVITKVTTGTSWLGNTTVLALTGSGKLLSVNATNMASQQVGDVSAYLYGATQATSLVYNPLISPYIYGSAGHYVGGVDATEIFVWDTNFNLVKEVNLYNQVLSARELAFDSKGNLFIGAFGNQIAWVIPGSAAKNPSTMTDDSAVLYYTNDYYVSYSGLDIASSVGTGPAHTYLPADFNHDLKVSFADYLILEANFGKTGVTNASGDANGDGKCSFADYLVLESEFGHTTTPEPATIGLLVLGGLGLLRKRGD